MRSRTFERLAGAISILVAVGGLIYSIAFTIFLKADSKPAAQVAAFVLTVGGILTTAVMVALYERLRDVDPALALWGLVLGVAGGLGAAIHGGSDLARFINPPKRVAAVDLGNVPNPVDPRGLLTFGLAGLGLMILSLLIVREHRLPQRLGQLGFVAGGLLIVVYLGRLIILDPNNPVLLTVAVLAGFIASPAFFVWLGVLLREQAGEGAGAAG
jgi:hypothetical protein